jgi:integrase
LPTHAQGLVEFLYLTGWRSSEAFRLEWSDVDWKRQTVLLRDSRNREPRIFDFRRTAVRNLIRAGVQQSIAMKITGHKTDSIFRRYLIVDEELLAQATGAVAEMLGDARRSMERNPG